VPSPKFEAQPLHGFRERERESPAVSFSRTALKRKYRTAVGWARSEFMGLFSIPEEMLSLKFEAQPLHGFRERDRGSPAVSFSRTALKRKYWTAVGWARSEFIGLFSIPEGCCPPNLRLNLFTDFENETAEVLPYRFPVRR
ncbi:hypothetical protein Taro_050217, partial [Colocasia esculenta]|nr:hypothetical protein [Colocasia esculenta]